jgi:hypothetical protein
MVASKTKKILIPTGMRIQHFIKQGLQKAYTLLKSSLTTNPHLGWHILNLQKILRAPTVLSREFILL